MVKMDLWDSPAWYKDWTNAKVNNFNCQYLFNTVLEVFSSAAYGNNILNYVKLDIACDHKDRIVS